MGIYYYIMIFAVVFCTTVIFMELADIARGMVCRSVPLIDRLLPVIPAEHCARDWIKHGLCKKVINLRWK